MRNPFTNVLFLSVLALIAIVVIFITTYSPGNITVGSVIMEYEELYSVGDSLSGTLSITIESGDKVPADTPMIISLNKGNEIIEVETLILKEFISLSNNPVESQAGYYQTPGTYSIDVAKLISYQFNEKGNYELFFNIPALDITVRQNIVVN